MNMEFIGKLPIPQEIKNMYPLPTDAAMARERRDREIKDVLSGKSDRFLLVIGPCSADSEDSVMEYLCRIKQISMQVEDKILIIPRVYTSKPRSTGFGYKGMLHQPDPSGEDSVLDGIIAIRKLHMRALTETGLSCADEMLYPENYRYLSDILGYVAVGARSVEDQQHRLVASGLNIPVGMKNPMGGNLESLVNSIYAARLASMFIYRGWEVKSHGNPYAHAVLRGYTDAEGVAHANYDTESIYKIGQLYEKADLGIPSILIDTNHTNSGKDYVKQIEIAEKVADMRNCDATVRRYVRGLMIESYLEDGCHSSGEARIFGKSITDPCLGWKKTQRLILNLADKV